MGVIPSAEELAGLLIHKRIRATRDGLGMTQPEFGKAIGVAERTVKRWEAGENTPDPANAERIGALAGRPAELYFPQEGDWADMRAFVAAVDRLEALIQDSPAEATARSGGRRTGVVTPLAQPAQSDTDTSALILGRLERLEERVKGLPKARDVERGFDTLAAAIAALANRGRGEAPPAASPGGDQ